MKRFGTCALVLLVWAQRALAQVPTVQVGGIPPRSLGAEIGNLLLWMVVAAVLFVVSFKIVDWTTPGDLKQQLVEGNTAMAIYVGALAIAVAIIIAALVG